MEKLLSGLLLLHLTGGLVAKYFVWLHFGAESGTDRIFTNLSCLFLGWITAFVIIAFYCTHPHHWNDEPDNFGEFLRSF